MEAVAKADPRALALPIIYTPDPVIGMSPDTLYKKLLEGNDPETGKPVIDEILDVLTKPQEKKKNGSRPSAEPEFPKEIKPDTEDNLQQVFYDRGWTDGLPIILPTEERVQNMLTGTSHSPDEEVGQSYDHDHHEIIKYTVRDIAVVAVMAGAKPEYFPVILAIASMRQSSIAPSTTAFGSMLLINGPVRNELGMNSGIAAFSPINQANSVIGRAWTLLSISWGYARVKRTLWSSQGCTELYNNMCVAENEERSPWAPFHVDKGFKPKESIISLFRGWAMVNSIGCAANRPLHEELSRQFTAIPPLGSRATIVMDPLVASNLKNNEGFETKMDYCKHLSENIKIKAEDYWKTDHIDMLVSSEAARGVEPFASWKALPDDVLFAPFHMPENINLIVVGGETSPLWKASEYGYSGSASVDKWRA
ncbi:UGSC family (seleno)protein [Chloroflexota bacterium]